MIGEIFAFLLGASLGSFANVVIFRMDELGSIISVPSHCPHCKHRLAWHDLVPIFSFLTLRGRCRYCGKKISPQYPIVEAALGFLAVLLVLEFGLTAVFFLHLLVVTTLVILLVYDLQTMLLPDVIVYPGIILSFLAYFAANGATAESFERMLLGALVGGGFLAALYYLGKGKWIGFGDTKLGILMGVLLGWPLIVAALIISFFSGSIVAGVLLAGKRKTLRSEIPFGPFLVFGTLVALFLGKELLSWYQRAFI